MNIDASMIKEGMPVRELDGKEVGAIATITGDFIELNVGEGESRWISLAMVERVGDEVHLNADEKELNEVWVDEDPTRPEKMSDG
jgi:hypothetical protein